MITKEELDAALAARHGRDIQQKLKQARVAIAGLGGLGSHIAFMLTRGGIGHLHLIDFDRIDASNLNRQCYPAESLGEYKTERLQYELHRANPYVEITTTTIKLTPENISRVLGTETIVCEAFDSAPAKAMLIEHLLIHQPQIKIVSGTGMAGYASSNLIHTERKLKNLWVCGDQHNGVETQGSLFASRVSICAAHQANMIIRLLLGQEEP